MPNMKNAPASNDTKARNSATSQYSVKPSRETLADRYPALNSFERLEQVVTEHGLQWKPTGSNEAMFTCPNCGVEGDRTPSIHAIYNRAEEKTIIHGFHDDCPDAEQVCGALGIAVSDLFDHPKQARAYRNGSKRRALADGKNRVQSRQPRMKPVGEYVIPQASWQVEPYSAFTPNLEQLCRALGVSPQHRMTCACPQCGVDEALHLTYVPVPRNGEQQQAFLLAACEQCPPAELFERFQTPLGTGEERVTVSAARMNISDTHVMVLEDACGLVFDYGDGLQVCRTCSGSGKKAIVQRGNTRGAHPLYLQDQFTGMLNRLRDDKSDAPVFVTEGEKDALALCSEGYLAMSTLGGAQGVNSRVDMTMMRETLAGLNVVVVVDRDENKSGLRWADAIRERLTVAGSVSSPKSLTFIQGRGSVHDAGDAVALNRYEFDVIEPVEPSLDATGTDSSEERGRFESVIEFKPRKLKPVDYLYAGMGFILVSGPNDVGKSSLIHRLAARVAMGATKGEWAGEPHNVLFVLSEDDPSSVAQSMIAHHVPPSVIERRVMTYVVDDGISESGGAHYDYETVRLPDDIPMLRSLCHDKQIRMVVFDAMAENLTGLNTNDQDDMNRVFRPLNKWAQEDDMLIIGVHHNKKGVDGDGKNAVRGAGAWTDKPRIVVGIDQTKNGERVFQLIKVKGRSDKPAYTYHFHTEYIPLEDGSRKPVGIVDKIEETTMTIDDIRGQRQRESVGGATADDNEVQQWLIEVLSDGPMRYKELEAMAKDDNGYTKTQLSNARRRMHDGYKIITRPDPDYKGRGKPSLWQLVNTQDPDASQPKLLVVTPDDN